MAIDTIRIYAENPDKILTDIRAMIKKEETDKKGLKTWKEDKLGFYHTGDGDQWAKEARLKFEVEEYEADGKKKKRAVSKIAIQPGHIKDVDATTGVYLGRFAEMLTTHFGNQISNIALF